MTAVKKLRLWIKRILPELNMNLAIIIILAFLGLLGYGIWLLIPETPHKTVDNPPIHPKKEEISFVWYQDTTYFPSEQSQKYADFSVFMEHPYPRTAYLTNIIQGTHWEDVIDLTGNYDPLVREVLVRALILKNEPWIFEGPLPNSRAVFHNRRDSLEEYFGPQTANLPAQLQINNLAALGFVPPRNEEISILKSTIQGFTQPDRSGQYRLSFEVIDQESNRRVILHPRKPK